MPTSASTMQPGLAPEASPENLYDLVAGAVRTSPHRVAVGTADGKLELSYRELDVAVREFAIRLARLGVGPGDMIALSCDNSMEFVLTLLAAASIGVAVAPLDPALPASGLASRVAAVRARTVIVAAHLYDGSMAAQLAGRCQVWQVEASRSGTSVRAVITVPGGSAAPLAAAHPVPGGAALLLSTAGSTSAPKVVPLTVANVAASVRGIQATYRLGPEDATLLVMPLYHGHGLIAGLLATLASGGAAWLPEARRFSASRFWTEMVAVGATWYTAVPTIHQILLERAAAEYPWENPPRLRFIRSCSAPLAPAVFRQLEAEFSVPVVSAYGMTETAHQAASNPLPGSGPVKPGSVGIGTGVEVQIVSPNGRVVAPGTHGEICVRGPAVASGYLDDPANTDRSFTGGWFHTGDLGYQDADGYLFLTGRSKELINRGGEKFSPQQIDAVLLSNAKVQDALSFGVLDEKYGEEINAAVILKPGQQAEESDLKDYSRTQLGAAGMPKRIFFVSKFPLTAKKVGDRRKLAARLAAGESPAFLRRRVSLGSSRTGGASMMKEYVSQERKEGSCMTGWLTGRPRTRHQGAWRFAIGCS